MPFFCELRAHARESAQRPRNVSPNEIGKRTESPARGSKRGFHLSAKDYAIPLLDRMARTLSLSHRSVVAFAQRHLKTDHQHTMPEKTVGLAWRESSARPEHHGEIVHPGEVFSWREEDTVTERRRRRTRASRAGVIFLAMVGALLALGAKSGLSSLLAQGRG